MSDAARDLSEFLASRRAKITPEQVGLPSYGQRRVPGLRREEVASLAGVSVEYYRRLERGNATGASELVLEGLADALRLDDAERAHLFDLTRAANAVTPRRRRRGPSTQLRPAMQQILDHIDAPASISTERGDYLATNPLGRALYAPMFESPEQPPNSARFTFLNPAAQSFFIDWEQVARDLVATLRALAGRDPHDRALSDLVGELSTRSDTFRTWWAAHDVRHHRTGTKRLHHPVIGEIELNYEVMHLAADTTLRLAIFTAEPGSRAEESLRLLGSWTATPTPNKQRKTPDSAPTGSRSPPPASS
jgi:transcriptional regulator with XRE-family HTH domain